MNYEVGSKMTSALMILVLCGSVSFVLPSFLKVQPQSALGCMQEAHGFRPLTTISYILLAGIMADA